LHDLLADDAFQRGDLNTDLVDQHFNNWQRHRAPSPNLALIAAALADMLAGGDAPSGAGETRGRRSDPYSGAVEMRGDPYSPWRQLSNFRVGEAHQK
jgi:hypothetical protein